MTTTDQLFRSEQELSRAVLTELSAVNAENAVHRRLAADRAHKLQTVLQELYEINELLCDGFAGEAGVRLGKLLDAW